MILIFDVDGTLADNNHRQNHLEKNPPDWDAFLAPELVEKDTPFENAQHAVKNLRRFAKRIVVLTGRNEALRHTTEEWLKKHFDLELSFEDLYMRPMGNFLSASEYKRDTVERLARRFQGETLFFFDDDAYTHPVYERVGTTFVAPACWDVMFPRNAPVGPQAAFSK